MPDLTRQEVIKKILAIALQARLAGVDLSELNLSGLNFSEAGLDPRQLERIQNFGQCLFARRPGLEDANLERAILINANLKEANLKGARLCNADMSGADLTDANMYDTDLQGARMEDVKGLKSE